MTLTVRLRPELESALELHCAERGVTKSLVVQAALAEYLARPMGRQRRRSVAAADAPAEPSATYRAFEALGLIGAVSGVGPADKAGVHAKLDSWVEAKRRSWAAQAAPAPKEARRAKRAAR